MAFANIIQRAWRENIPYSALVELTYRCNLDCFFCYNDLKLQGVPLSLEHYFQLFEDLRALGTVELALTGGEPLAHPDFFPLGRKARELGFVIRVKSNGHALTGKLARRLKDEVDPFGVDISLHGASAEIHNRQTRTPGSFQQLLANLREMQAAGLRVRLKTPLTVWNEKDIEALYELADERGLRLDLDPTITPRDDDELGPLTIAPSREGVLRLFQLQRQRAARIQPPPARPPAARSREETSGVPADKHCGAGSGGLAVDPYGNVYPCVQWRQRIGNLHEQSIRSIWNSSPDLAEIRRLNVAVKQHIGSYGAAGQSIAFCPGLAAQQAGSPLHLYPAAKLRLELHAHLESRQSHDPVTGISASVEDTP